MSRYFLEVAYKGTAYSGFQSQANANSIQAELERSFQVLQREPVSMVCSSRTDAGVHALQNFLHFDYTGEIHPHFVYKMNAILPADIVVRSLTPVADDAHARFDAISRLYRYYVYMQKNPFYDDRAWYFPFKIDRDKMEEASQVLLEYNDFRAFSKKHTQVKTFVCNIMESQWTFRDNRMVYNVKADRFLRGMVRALTATMLKLGRGKITMSNFREIIEGGDCTKAFFEAPAKGLFLVKVDFNKR